MKQNLSTKRTVFKKVTRTILTDFKVEDHSYKMAEGDHIKKSEEDYLIKKDGEDNLLEVDRGEEKRQASLF